MAEIQYETKRYHSHLMYISYGLTSFALGLMMNFLVGQTAYFYETVIGLPIALFAIGFSLFTIWDMINDVIAATSMDRTYSFTKRWGKRFPFYIVFALPIGIVSILFFTPPALTLFDGLLTFGWFVIILLIYDTTIAFTTVSNAAILTDKYRTDADRKGVAIWVTILGIIGGVAGATLGTLGMNTSIASEFVLRMALFAIIGTILIILSIPGHRLSREALDQRLVHYAIEEQERENSLVQFFKIIRNGFRDKNFVGYLILTLCVSVFTALFAPSIIYFVDVVMRIPPAQAGTYVTLVSIPYIIVGIVLIPLFSWLISKFGHLKMFKVSMYLMPIALIPFLFISDLTSALFVAAAIGAIAGLKGITQTPVVGDLIDDASVRENKRVDATYNAAIVFFTQFGQFVMAMTLAVIHTITGYVAEPGYQQNALAVFGIRAQIALVPMIFWIVGVIVFVKLWDLVPEKMIGVKEKLAEMGI